MRGVFSNFLKKQESGISPAEKRVCKFLTDNLGIQPDLEEFLLQANAIEGFRDSILASFVERAVSRRPNTRKLDLYRRELSGRVGDVKTIRLRILEYLARLCFRFKEKKASDIFGNFVAAISAKGCPVFTTNYDSALEFVAGERGISVEDNFLQPEQPGSWQLWNPEIRFPTGNALTLIKLHGSMTWYAASDGSIQKNHLPVDMNLVDVDRLIIFPTRFKDIYEQHFFALYSHFLAILATAKVLIIAGHSLRDEYLRAAIIERFRKGGLKIIVIDPSYPPAISSELKSARLGSSGPVTYVPLKFEEFCDDIAYFVRHFEPAQIPDRCAEIVQFRKSRSSKVAMKGRVGRLKAGNIIEFSAQLEAYLPPDKKPAKLRAWIETPSDAGASKVTSEFLEGGNIEIKKDSPGLIQDSFPITVNVPEVPEWDAYGRVSLKVALLSSSIRRPNRLSAREMIAVDSRELSYNI